jgi:putative hydrolase of the HAD superfamily
MYIRVDILAMYALIYARWMCIQEDGRRVVPGTVPHQRRVRSASVADRTEAWLVDLYETALTVDWATVWHGLAAVAGVPLDRFRPAVDEAGLRLRVMAGGATMRDAFGDGLGACGREPDGWLLDELVAADERLIIEASRLYDDVVGFLGGLRATGCRVAIVSNCAEQTGALVAHHGLDELVDAVVLSCEVRSLKPEPEIYLHALAMLGAGPDQATLVDDQRSYCEGAVGVGMRALHLDRKGLVPSGHTPPEGITVVRNLTGASAHT